MGLGKTYQMAAVIKSNECPTLIVTTKSTMGQWCEALNKITGRSATTVYNKLVAGELPPVSSSKQIFVTTYDTIVSQVEEINRAGGKRRAEVDATRTMVLRHYGRIVLDEAHLIRNRNTGRFKSIMWLSAAHRWALTGTPINNQMDDLESLSEWIGVRLVGNPAMQRRFIMRRTMDQVFGAASSDINSAKDTNSHQLLRPPGIRTTIVRLTFSSIERDIYQHLEADLAAKFSDTQQGGEGCTQRERDVGRAAEIALKGKSQSHQAMESILRLRQVCVHPHLYWDGICRKRSRSACFNIGNDAAFRLSSDIIRSTKIEYIVNGILTACKSDANVKAIVFCEWLKEMDLIEMSFQRNQEDNQEDNQDQRHQGQSQASLPHAPLECLRFHGTLSPMERSAVLQRFSLQQNESPSPVPVPRVMLVQIRAGGTGLNLQAASIVYITSPSWNPCNELQALSRAYRQCQSREVIFERVIMEGTIEEKCIDTQHEKLVKLDALLEEATYGNFTPSPAIDSSNAGIYNDSHKVNDEVNDEVNNKVKDKGNNKDNGNQRLTCTDILLKRMGYSYRHKSCAFAPDDEVNKKRKQ